MLLTWSSHQKGAGSTVVSYLLDRSVFKQVGRQSIMVVRDTVPEVLYGGRTSWWPTSIICRSG